MQKKENKKPKTAMKTKTKAGTLWKALGTERCQWRHFHNQTAANRQQTSDICPQRKARLIDHPCWMDYLRQKPKGELLLW